MHQAPTNVHYVPFKLHGGKSGGKPKTGTGGWWWGGLPFGLCLAALRGWLQAVSRPLKGGCRRIGAQHMTTGDWNMCGNGRRPDSPS